MLKWLVIVTIIFLILILGLVNDALSVYNVTHYIDVAFISFLGGFLLLIYGIIVSMVVLAHKN